MTVRVEPGAEPIPGYKLIDRIGGGGFGEVWKAEAPGGLLKAIKIVYGDLQTTDPDGTRRTEQELKALKRVQSVRHPYLLSLERYDIVEGRLLIVMELADRNMWDRFRECRTQNLTGIPREELLRYMEESAEVLDLMNTEHQLQHLDIKPQNLFLVHNHAKVADFGLVKDLEGMMATVTGGITPVYAAPETFDGKVTRFCDQYSLAIVYQELLTGQRPFSGNSLQQLIMQHLTGTPNLTPLPKSDRQAIARSLSKKPEGRFPSCQALVRELRAASGNSGTEPTTVSVRPPVPPPTPAERPSPEARVPVVSKTLARREPQVEEQTPPYHGEFDADAEPPVSPPRWDPTGTPRGPYVPEETGPPVQDLPPQRQAPPEITGPGVLFPALVIGVGQKGREVLEVLREALTERFGSLQQLAQLRMLYIDTDPESGQTAAQPDKPAPLNPAEILLARLNRASHYIKPRDGRMPLDSWFNSKLLYRMQRTPTTTGLRCLGRLALVDNYRLIVGRLRSELEACIKPEAISAANRQTRLGMRTNRPRVYVAASLTGGTGSGMFLDLAYLLRHQLFQLGYTDPDIVGMFLLPRPDPQSGMTLGIGNAYAALLELNHYNSPDTTFTFSYDQREGKLKDREPPFRRSVLVPLEAEEKQAGPNRAVRLLGDYLCRDLTTPLGRAADTTRAAVVSIDAFQPGTCQTVGMYRFTWPRRALLEKISRSLCHELVLAWNNTEAAPMVEPLKHRLNNELSEQRLDVEHLIEYLQHACTKALGQAPETTFNELILPIIPQSRRDPDPDPEEVLALMQKLELLVGGPVDNAIQKPPQLADVLEKASDSVVRTWVKKVSKMVSNLIEEPDFRLAGAEEAIRQLTGYADNMLEHHDGLLAEINERAAETYAQFDSSLELLIANPGGGRRTAAVVAELLEMLQQYPKLRYQSLVLRKVVAVFTSLRGQLSDQMREVNFCRNRLNEMIRDYEKWEQEDQEQAEAATSAYLLPGGCNQLEDAVNQVIGDLTEEEFLDLDRRTQAMIQQQFTSLSNVCLASANLIKNLQHSMQELAEGFVGSRLAGANIVDMFLAQYRGKPTALPALRKAFDGARPDLAPQSPRAHLPVVNLLALPPGPAAQEFRGLVKKAIPSEEIGATDSADDIIFYREIAHLPLTNLPLFGTLGEEAYRQMLTSEYFTPHSRQDITEWLPIDPEEATDLPQADAE